MLSPGSIYPLAFPTQFGEIVVGDGHIPIIIYLDTITGRYAPLSVIGGSVAHNGTDTTQNAAGISETKHMTDLVSDRLNHRRLEGWP
jgi:hypothetical protein